jgi:hypothetical protein
MCLKRWLPEQVGLKRVVEGGEGVECKAESEVRPPVDENLGEPEGNSNTLLFSLLASFSYPGSTQARCLFDDLSIIKCKFPGGREFCGAPCQGTTETRTERTMTISTHLSLLYTVTPQITMGLHPNKPIVVS